MTEITVIRGDDGSIVGLRGQGHSGPDPKGRNIICASVTTIFEMLSEATEDLPEESLTFRRKPDIPEWYLEISPGKLSSDEWATVKSFLSAALGVFRNIAERHPDRCRLID